MHVCGDDPFAPWTGTYTHVSEGTPIFLDATWAFVPGPRPDPDEPDLDVNGSSLDRGLNGQLNLTPPLSVNFSASNFYGRRVERHPRCHSRSTRAAQTTLRPARQHDGHGRRPSTNRLADAGRARSARRAWGCAGAAHARGQRRRPSGACETWNPAAARWSPPTRSECAQIFTAAAPIPTRSSYPPPASRWSTPTARLGGTSRGVGADTTGHIRRQPDCHAAGRTRFRRAAHISFDSGHRLLVRGLQGTVAASPWVSGSRRRG